MSRDFTYNSYIGNNAIIRFYKNTRKLTIQPGDVVSTYDFDYRPNTDLTDGIL